MNFYKINKVYKAKGYKTKGYKTPGNKTTGFKTAPKTTLREQRLDQRKPASLPAMIWGEQSNSQRCRITSISMTGLFLEMDDARLPVGAVVQLFFYGMIDGVQKLCCDWVRVVGEREAGLAVRFIRFDNQHQCNLQLMLHQAVIHPAALVPPKSIEPNYSRKSA